MSSFATKKYQGKLRAGYCSQKRVHWRACAKTSGAFREGRSVPRPGKVGCQARRLPRRRPAASATVGPRRRPTASSAAARPRRPHHGRDRRTGPPAGRGIVRSTHHPAAAAPTAPGRAPQDCPPGTKSARHRPPPRSRPMSRGRPRHDRPPPVRQGHPLDAYVCRPGTSALPARPRLSLGLICSDAPCASSAPGASSAATSAPPPGPRPPRHLPRLSAQASVTKL